MKAIFVSGLPKPGVICINVSGIENVLVGLTLISKIALTQKTARFCARNTHCTHWLSHIGITSLSLQIENEFTQELCLLFRLVCHACCSHFCEFLLPLPCEEQLRQANLLIQGNCFHQLRKSKKCQKRISPLPGYRLRLNTPSTILYMPAMAPWGQGHAQGAGTHSFSLVFCKRPDKVNMGQTK